MNETIREWLDKAEGDFRTAERELNVEHYPNYDAACFHAQQCIEKLLKALLIHGNSPPPKIHDLLFLKNLLPTTGLDIAISADDLRYLTRAAVDFRYPGESADKDEAEEAFRICREAREKLLALLLLP